MACSYWNSTQRHEWNFNRPQLLEMRNEVSSIESRYGMPDDHISDQLINGWNPHIKIFIHNQLLKLGKRLSCRQIIISTAEVYVSRFLLKVSTREVNIYMLLATSLYLASKTEENPQHIRQFLSESRQLWPEYIPNDLTKLAEFEFYLIEELGCFLIVHHPYDSLVTITGILQGEDFNVKLSDEERGTCWSIVNDSYATDIHLLYPPHVVAISALIMVIVLVTKPNNYLLDKYESSGNHYNFSETGSRLTESAISRLVASSNTNLDQITECMQELIILYENWLVHDEYSIKKSLHHLLQFFDR